MLEVIGLKKRFGERLAVEGISFQVAKGECVGLLGPNGAGKTTTVSMITGLVRPDEGEVRIDGGPLAADDDPRKRKLGLVPQELALYEELSARDNLNVFGALYGLTGAGLTQAVDRALETVSLADRHRHRVSTFSGGMKRRLNLAAALLHAPELLILDEPTVGVDPQSRNAIFDNLEKLRAAGMTLLYTTHYMEEAERLCDRIVIIDQGKVIANDTLRGLYRLLPASQRLTVELAEAPASGWQEGLRRLAGVESVNVAKDQLSVGLRDLKVAPSVLSFLIDQGIALLHAQTDRPNLEAVFLNLTGRKLRDA
jgi:linearmycin/streptolysin S transport system ATP-binding protein